MSRLWVLLALLGWHHLVPRLFRLMNHQSKDIFTDYMISGNMHRLGHWVTSDGFSFDLYALMFLFMNIMWLVNRICTILMAISIRYSNVFFDFAASFLFRFIILAGQDPHFSTRVSVETTRLVGAGLSLQASCHESLITGTPPETNVAPKNKPSQKEISIISTIHFQVLC